MNRRAVNGENLVCTGGRWTVILDDVPGDVPSPGADGTGTPGTGDDGQAGPGNGNGRGGTGQTPTNTHAAG